MGAARALLPPLALAVAVRAVLLVAAWDAPLVGDEAAYLRLGTDWREHGAYAGPWAPLHPRLLGWLVGAFGDGAPNAARVGLAVLQLGLVALVVALARAAYGERAARVAAWLAAAYLPLAAFAHLLYSETVFLLLLLGAAQLLLAVVRSPEGAPFRAAGAGLLCGLALLTRESAMLLVPCLAVATGLALRRAGRAWLAPPAAVLATAALVVAPWTARNLHAYDRLVPVGTTAGSNAFVGWNTLRYLNFDVTGLEVDHGAGPGGALRGALLEPAPEPWTLDEVEPNRADRSATLAGAGAAFLVAHPGWTLRSRLLRLSDIATPLTFGVRALRTDGLGAPLDAPVVRHAFLLASLLSFPLLALLALAGAAGARAAPGWGVLATALVVGVALACLVQGMSRLRLPAEPALLVVAAGGIAARWHDRTPRRIAWAGAGAAVLLLLWWIALPPTLASARAAW